MSKSNTVICAAERCYSSLVTHPSKNFFGFPSDISLCKTWLENCGRTDLNLQKVTKRSYWRLCEDHFEDKWFTDSSRKILKRKLNPVPTIFVNNISSLLPSGTEPESIDVDCNLSIEDLMCVEFVEEGHELTGDAFDLSVSTVKKQQLPISYDTKPLLKSIESSTEVARKNLVNFNTDTELHIIDKICRFCMNKVSLDYIDMFSKTDDAKAIRKVSEIILPDKISICDGLPHKVCQKCILDLKTCLRLIEQVQNADQCLRAIAKYSLFMENESTTEISVESEGMEAGINYDNCIISQPTDTVAQSLKKSVEEPYKYLDRINIDSSLEVKNNFNPCIFVTTSNNSNYPETLNLQERSTSEKPANSFSSNRIRHKQTLNHDVKFYKRLKKTSSSNLINEIIVMSQDHLNEGSREETTCEMSNFVTVKSIEEINVSVHKCTHCLEVFRSYKTLQQHVKSIHEK